MSAETNAEGRRMEAEIAAQRASAETKGERCPEVNPRTGEQCDLSKGHRGPHGAGTGPVGLVCWKTRREVS